ncbi:MAG: hypothetical protein R2710_20935 [Acidimicrobiales bacterium]
MAPVRSARRPAYRSALDTRPRTRHRTPLFTIGDEDRFVEQLVAGFGSFPPISHACPS